MHLDQSDLNSGVQRLDINDSIWKQVSSAEHCYISDGTWPKILLLNVLKDYGFQDYGIVYKRCIVIVIVIV